MKAGDIIAAQATPAGRGGVGIIRVSGPDLLSITEKLLGKKLKEREATFCDFLSDDKKIIDKGIALYFAAPFSFTGEDVLELHGHGGQVVMDLVLKRVLDLGARLAKPGEFSQRAFLNKKIDLAQAEAVADLIDASTSQAAKNAMQSLQGEFSKKVNGLVGLLTNLRTKIEAAIDFTEEEDVDILQNERVKENLTELANKIKELKGSSEQGLIIQEGIKVAIVGKPNAGKSSLLNCLSGEDTAIVTDIPGTTRDLLKAQIQADGLKINLIDTAGFHDNPGIIEKEGIRRAKEEIKKADHVLVMIDSCIDKIEDLGKDFLNEVSEDSRLTFLYNKIDLTGEQARAEKIDGVDVIFFSVKTGTGIDLLKRHLKESAGVHTIEQGFSARRRHVNALEKAERYLENIDGGNLELIAEDLKEMQNVLGEITGKVTNEDLLSKIFADFCIGK